MEKNTFNLVIMLVIIFIAALTYIIGRRSYRIASDKVRAKLFDNRKKNQQDIEKEKNFTLEKGLGEMLKSKVKDFLDGSKFKYLTYDYIYAYLSKNGQMIEGVRMTTPEVYVLTKCVSAIICVIAVFEVSHNVLITAAAFIMAVTYQDVSIYIENKQDNRKMLEDIQHIHERISMQIKSNIYIADTFNDCYLYSVNPRLKRAFLEMDSEIKLTHNLNEALDSFEGKFNNPSITLLCQSIRQAGEVGRLNASLESMKREAGKLQKMQNYIYKEDLDRKFSIFVIGIFGMVVLIILYLFMGEFSSNVKSLFTF